jgi:hypothetical protein
MKAIQGSIRFLLRALIRLYQFVISPLFPATCRYAPSCSEYAIEAISKFGAIKGGGLALRRILHCHPWGGSGYDPVPNTDARRNTAKEKTQSWINVTS